MKRSNRAFTLVELLIVISILMVLSGVLSNLWIKMERISKSLHTHTQFYVKGKQVLDRMAKDIQHANGFHIDGDALITLTQHSMDGSVYRVAYKRIDREIIREELDSQGRLSSRKIITLNDEVLSIQLDTASRIRLEWTKERRNRPLESREYRLLTFVEGGISHE
jgi:prepilin-type N-terminal cleavage/methylation domain-containing protein